MSEGNGTQRYTAEQAVAFREANADFPLHWHREGGWSKKVRGRRVYFGKVEPAAALERYHAERTYLERGELPPAYPCDGVSLRQLANEFLAARRALVDSGELTEATWADYHRTLGRLIAVLGAGRAVANLRPEDFITLRSKLAEGRGLASLLKEVNQARIIFKFAYESGLIDRPVRFGSSFKRPTLSAMRRARAGGGRRDFSVDEVRSILDATTGQLRTMVLLGVSCGLGNGDVASLEIRHLDGAWLVFPRPKNGAPRRAWLWPEVVDALSPLCEGRTSGRVFRTRQWNPWNHSAVSREFGKVLDRLGLSQGGRGFYGLRRAFRTLAAETGDEPAINLVMGHTDTSMPGLYTQRISDGRLRRVGEAVRLAIRGPE
jgi:integrase